MVIVMNELKADFIANIKLYNKEEGGRESPTPADKLGCIFEFDGENFDCFLLLHEKGSLQPGYEGNVPIVFLNPQYVKDRLKVGSRFTLRDYRIIGVGEVEEILT